MNRSITALAAAFVLTSAAAGGAASSPEPAGMGAAHAHHSPSPSKTPSFSNSVKVPPAKSGNVSAQACDRRSIGVNNSRGQMGAGSTSKSQTLVSIPIGGGSAGKSAVRQSQINEACGHTR